MVRECCSISGLIGKAKRKMRRDGALASFTY
jgi:hypothetical protein